VVSGSTPSFNQCRTDADCAAGAWCNHTTQACQPICLNTANCAAEGGQCEPALQSNGTTPIPGLNVCAAHCDLVTAMPCGPHLNCVYQSSLQEFECVLSANGAKQSPCTADADCSATLTCGDDGFGTLECLSWCTPPGSHSAQGCAMGTCSSLASPVQRGTTSYGICSN
jgi:hypothetical protein